MCRTARDVPLLPPPATPAQKLSPPSAAEQRQARVQALVDDYGYTFSPWLRFWYKIKM
tara:strand:- start:77 stop:250 length:174 start_codon:yes stop_codon:yes gene_type:complete